MPRVGEVLGSRYRIEGLLGAGGMATVHRATDLRLGRPVAVKVLLPNLARDPDLVARFEREARALAAVGHPAIVDIYDVEAEDEATGEAPFIVMELCEGGSLAEQLAVDGRLPPDEVVPLAARIAEGLAALHAAGIVHRDVKPHNILLAPSGAKLADFGIASLGSVNMSDTLTSQGTILGSVAYSPPELLAGEPATAASDTYGLGAVVYQALTGRRPREATDLAAAIEARHRLPDPPSTVTPELGAAFDDALAAALAPDPGDRPDPLAFAAALTLALRRWEHEPSGIEAAPPTPPILPVAALPGIDAEATTLVDPMAVDASITEAPAATVEPSRRGWRVPLAVAGIGIAALAIVTAASFADLLGSSGLPSPSGGAPGSRAPQVSPSPTSASALASPSPPAATASASPQVSPMSVEAALEAVRDAVRDASEVLDGDAAKDLADRVDDIESALAEDGVRKATQRTRDLAKRVNELIRAGKIEGELAARLDDAVEALLRELKASASGG